MRITTGLRGLDKIINGGFPEKTAILLSGTSGTGKTLLGLNFLMEGSKKKQRCVYLSLSESKEEILRACEGINSLKDAKKYIDKNFLVKNVVLGEKIDLDYFTNMFTKYPKVDRLVIDNVNKLLIHAKNSKDYRIKLAEMLRFIKEKVDSCLMLSEVTGDNIDTGNGEAFECDGVIHVSFLELEEKPKRTIEIHKMRYTSFDPLVHHEFVIDSKSLKLTKTKIL
jgi:circadian clock protein KaiC